jgi:hypothetical protein
MIEMKIRAYELEVGDLFIKQGTRYRVIKISDGKIFYDHRRCKSDSFLGAKSMEWVMWIGKYEPKGRPPAKPKKRSLNPKKPMIPVRVTTKEGEHVGSFRSIKQAARELKIDYKYIERYIKKELVKEKHPLKFEKIIVPST